MADVSEHSRSQCMPFPPREALAHLLLLATWLAFTGCAAAEPAGPKVWQDPVTGLAIGGYDPLAYFIRGAASRGQPGMELEWGGAVWRFLNPGNRAAFARHPQVYAPRFGGYDVTALASSRTTQGQPSIWSVYKDRIYLFHNAVNLRLWQQDRDRVIAAAEKNWPALAAALPSALAR